MSEDATTKVDETGTKDPAAVAPKQELFETAGRKFDIATPEGRRDLQMFTDGLSYSAGKNAQRAGDLEKEVEPFRKYDLKAPSLDEVAILKKVEELHQQGLHTDATKLALEYSRQVALDARVEIERERLWGDYVKSNKEVFNFLDEEMAKKYVMSEYKTQLEDEKDPLGFIDRVLRPKVSKIKPAEASTVVEDPPAVMGSGLAGATPPTTKSSTPADAKSDWDGLMTDMGFK